METKGQSSPAIVSLCGREGHETAGNHGRGVNYSVLLRSLSSAGRFLGFLFYELCTSAQEARP